MQQLPQLSAKVLLVRGKPFEEENLLTVPSTVEVVNHLNAAAIKNAFRQSHCIVGRSGYTTVMELLALQKKAILIISSK